MKLLTTFGLTESIRNGWPLAALAYIDHPAGAVRAWSGAGTLAWDGEDWSGVGNFGRVTGIGASTRLMLRYVVFELSGIPQDAEGESAISGLDEEVRNRPAKAWIAGLDASGAHVNGEPWLVVDGLSDYQELNVEDGGETAIQLTVAEPVFSIERAQALAWTPEWMKATRDPTAIGLDALASLAQKTVSWTLT